MQVHRVVHHGKVIQGNARDLIFLYFDVVSFGKRYTIHAPDVALHIPSQV